MAVGKVANGTLTIGFDSGQRIQKLVSYDVFADIVANPIGKNGNGVITTIDGSTIIFDKSKVEFVSYER